jgi:hypothetical protein
MGERNTADTNCVRGDNDDDGGGPLIEDADDLADAM